MIAIQRPAFKPYVIALYEEIHSLLTLYLLVWSADNPLQTVWDPDCFVGPDLDPNCLTLYS